MYEVKVMGEFCGAHALKGYRGKCEKLHGHNWKVEASALANDLDKVGMAIDFKVLKEKLNSILSEFDHSDLRSHRYFKKVNPTSENIAKFVYDKLAAALKKSEVELATVRVWETETSCASYYADE